MNTPVFYRGERYYVEHCPSVWSRGTCVRISSCRIPDDAKWYDLLGMAKADRLTEKRSSFYVHADELALAPALSSKAELVVAAGLKSGPSQHAVEQRAKQKAAGVTDVGDPVALKLREAKTLDDVYRIGAESLGVPEAELREKYGKLNPGQQRMNVGNRMRAKFRKEGKI